MGGSSHGYSQSANVAASRDSPQQVCRRDSTYHCPTVAQHVDELVQVLDLKPIVQGEPKTVSPVEQGKKAKHEQIHPHERWPNQGQQRFVAGRIQPSQGEGQGEQKQVDRHQHRRHGAAGTEEEPQEGFIRPFAHLPS